MNNFKRITVTAALPYANGPVHIGHLAGVYVPADIYVRYQRLKGRDVLFVCGSDEHGVPITIKARQEGITPQQVVDRYHGIIKQSFQDFGISFSNYSRTSAKIHHDTASEFFRTLYDKGMFAEKVSKQYFDEEANQFLADRYITGTCPKCTFERAYGDQCESCGTSLSPTELINPKSALSGNIPVLKETKHWYLPLDQYEGWLKEWILEGHKEWRSTVYGQCKSWIDSGLQPRAVTRDLDWGVPVPVEDAEGKVLYVWFDAPIGYISASKESNPNDWEKYWKDKETKLVHFIGKDNIVFHCIIFPVMLKAEGSYILPENVPANEFLNLEGEKISTSRNWAVWLHEYLEDFPGKQDVLRYALTANAPETKDNDFTWKDFQARNNNELLAILGNFINRILVLTNKYYEGIVPERGPLEDIDRAVIADISLFPSKIELALENYKFRDGLNELMNLARAGNKYLTETEPWKLAKENPERVKTIMNVSLQLTANLSILAEPFLPFLSNKLKSILKTEDLIWANAGMDNLIKANNKIGEAEHLVHRIEDADIEKQIEKLAATKKANELTTAVVNPAKENIEYDDFAKMDIRVVTILEAEKVAKTKKLMKLKVDTGVDIRIVVSGISEQYEPEDIIGKKVCMLINLAPKNLKGIDSNGMILMAENPNGDLTFVTPVKDFINGAEIR